MGESEERLGFGFVGASGVALLQMLHEAGVIELSPQDNLCISSYYSKGDSRAVNDVWLRHPEVYRSNVFQLHPPGNNLEYFSAIAKPLAIPGYPSIKIGQKTVWIDAKWSAQLDRLGDEILAIDPNLIIAFGNTALWALCGTTGISKLRGTTRLSTHTVSGYKVLCTYHPSAVLRQWENRPTTVIDLMKAPRENTYGEVRRPQREIWIEPTIADIEDFYARYIVGCRILAVDIETAGNAITCIGFSPYPGLALVVPFVDERRTDRSYWPSVETELNAWEIVRRILSNRDVKKSFQNGLYDIAFCWRAYGMPTYGAVEDTMLLSHALQPESLKGLAFLGSVYTSEGPWKSERKGANTTIKPDA